MNALKVISAVLLAVGGLNWGLVGIFNFNLVAELFGDFGMLSRIVYIAVGISAVLQAISFLPLEFNGNRVQREKLI